MVSGTGMAGVDATGSVAVGRIQAWPKGRRGTRTGIWCCLIVLLFVTWRVFGGSARAGFPLLGFPAHCRGVTPAA